MGDDIIDRERQMKNFIKSFALGAVLTTASMAEVGLDQLRNPTSPDGLNMGAVEARQKEMRAKGVSNDVSMKILGVAQQRSMEKKLVDEKAALLGNMPTDKKGRAEAEARLAQLDQKIKLFQETIRGQLHSIQDQLHLTPEQLANIKGVDHQAKMYETARSKSDPRITEKMPPLPPRPNEAPR